MPRSPLPNWSVGLEPLLGFAVLAAVLALELDLLSLPHAARTTPNAATAPPPPSAFRKRLRDVGSRSSSSSADRWGGRSLSLIMVLLLSWWERGRAGRRTRGRARCSARRARSGGRS